MMKGSRLKKQLQLQSRRERSRLTVAPALTARDVSSSDGGLEVWHSPPNAQVDVCFVHGLMGNHHTTWTAPGKSAPWPLLLLPSDLEHARLLTFGYDAHVVRTSSTVSTNGLAQHASDLLFDLTADQQSSISSSTSLRPLIFVAHSLGGIVCKEAILQSKDNPDPQRRRLFERLRAIAFMGTPHRGSWLAHWAEKPASLLGFLVPTNTTLLELLRSDSVQLDSVHRKFMAMVREQREGGRSLDLICFFEALPMKGVGLIVDRASASLDAFEQISIHAHHRDLVRFASPDDAGYRRLLQILRSWTPVTPPNPTNLINVKSSASATSSINNAIQEGSPSSPALKPSSNAIIEPPSMDSLKDSFSFAAPMKDASVSDPIALPLRVPSIVSAPITQPAADTAKPTAGPAAEKNAFIPPPSLPDCLQSLAFAQMQERAQDVEVATEGTCKWLLDHNVFKDWRRSHQGMLWIQGKPGSGKSTLLKHVLTRVLSIVGKRDVSQRALVLSFYFHARGSQLQKTPLGFLRTLLHQLLELEPAAAADVVHVYDRNCTAMGRFGEKWNWHERQLRELIEICLPRVLRVRPLWLFIDALDEAGKENAVTLLQWLNGLLKKLSTSCDSNFVHFCVTCRHYPVLLHRNCHYQVCPEQENAADIAAYVNHRLLSTESLGESDIPAIITDRASGVFMWARLVIDHALALDSDGASLAKIRREILLIPKELDQLYRGLLRDGKNKSQMLRLVEWVCFSAEPLTLGHFRWALIIDADDINCPTAPRSLQQYMDGHEDYEPNDGRLWRRLKTLSCGLIEMVNENFQWMGDDESDMKGEMVIQFIHQSVSDFFLDQGLLLLHKDCEGNDSAVRTMEEARQTAYLRMTKTCIRFLSLDEVEPTAAERDAKIFFGYGNLSHCLNFVNHATFKWVSYAQNFGQNVAMQRQVAQSFAWNGSDKTVRAWYQIWRPRAKDSRFENLLQVASFFGLSGLVTALLESECGRNDATSRTGIDQRTPLHLAAISGSHEAVCLLLQSGLVDVNARDYNDHVPLMLAAQEGHSTIVATLLLTDGIDVNARNSSGMTSLFLAEIGGYDAIVQLLLATDAIIIEEDKSRLLLGIVEGGNPKIVQQLIATGAFDADSKDTTSPEPLLRAIRNNHVEVVKQFLDWGIFDVNARSEEGDTALLLAVRKGASTIVRELLATGLVDINAKDKIGRTSFIVALDRLDFEVLEILVVARSSDINIKNKDGETALMLAARFGRHSLVQELVATGTVDLNERNKKGETAFLSAIAMSRFDVALLLLETDSVDINAKTNNGDTALTLAVYKGRIDFIQRLLAAGFVDVNAQTRDGQTALILAVRNGHFAVINLLLSIETIDINANKDSTANCTAFSMAISQGHYHIAQRLRDLGAADTGDQELYKGYHNSIMPQSRLSIRRRIHGSRR